MSSFRYFLVFLTLIQLIGCASHQAKEDPTLSANDNAIISNEPLSFLAQGSDSQKIPGLSTVHFPFDSAVVAPSEAKIVAQNAIWAKAHPNLKIQIEGHCDQRGSVEYNLGLGERRAKVIYKAMMEAGIDKDRLSVISYGEERPLFQGDSEEAYARNRRANFVPLNAPANTLSSTGGP